MYLFRQLINQNLTEDDNVVDSTQTDSPSAGSRRGSRALWGTSAQDSSSCHHEVVGETWPSLTNRKNHNTWKLDSNTHYISMITFPPSSQWSVTCFICNMLQDILVRDNWKQLWHHWLMLSWKLNFADYIYLISQSCILICYFIIIRTFF